MTRRRGVLIAATVAAAVLAMLTLGAREEEWREPTPEMCKTELDAVFEQCGSKTLGLCRYMESNDEEVDTCQAGCVMHYCPEQITCTELDPIWCGTACADPRGARYWSNYHAAHESCDWIVADDEDHWLDEDQFFPWRNCINAYMKQQCPEGHWRMWRPPDWTPE
jgi:hypothetical protein